MMTRWLFILGPVFLLGLALTIEGVDAEPPVIKRYIPPVEIWQEESITLDMEDFDGGVVFRDPEGTELNYGAHSNGEIIVTIAGSLLTFTGAPGFVGCASDIIIWAEDADGERSENMTLFFIVDTPGHGEPQVTGFEPEDLMVTTDENSTLTFAILNIRDLELEMAHIRWSIDGEELEGKDSPSIQFPDDFTGEDPYETSGSYTIDVDIWYTIDDESYIVLGDPRWVLEVLDKNRPPEIVYITNDQTLTRGDAIHLQVIADDGDLDNLTYWWVYSEEMDRVRSIGKDSTIVFDRSLAPGVHHFRCEVSDGVNVTVSRWITITIKDGHEPEVDKPASMTVITAMVVVWLARHRRFHRKAY